MRIIRVLLALGLAAVLQVDDGVHFNTAETASARFRYNVVAWEAENLLDKWTHRLSTLRPWSREGPVGRAALDEYLALSREIGRLSHEIDRAASAPMRDHEVLSALRSELSSAKTARLEVRNLDEYLALSREIGRLSHEIDRAASAPMRDHEVLSSLHEELSSARTARLEVRDEAEEAIEATVSSVLSELGLGSFGPVDYPPVDIRLDDPPSVVVTSPRHTISRGDEALVVPGLSVIEREKIEEALLAEADLSALVSDIGGVATYPAIVRSGFRLRYILQTAAHEWIHHYLVAHSKPLGLRRSRSNEMRTINETLADLVGREIGDMAYVGLGGTIDPPPNPAQAGAAPEVGKFDFSREMRATRLRVDSLLSEGKIEEAETYMEERRLVFVENGYHLRKINQAYFAFLGTYAERPESSDPVGEGMRRLRSAAPDLRTFISTVSAVGTPGEFAALVEDLGEGEP